MSEWKEYNGSDDQIQEIYNSRGWIVMFFDGVQSDTHIGYPGANVNMHAIHKYLICNPHPLADMIGQQAKTGQPVWVRTRLDDWSTGRQRNFYKLHEPTACPDWYLIDSEYSFTPFDQKNGRS